MKATITIWDLAAAVIIIGLILIGIWALTKWSITLPVLALGLTLIIIWAIRIGTQDER